MKAWKKVFTEWKEFENRKLGTSLVAQHVKAHHMSTGLYPSHSISFPPCYWPGKSRGMWSKQRAHAPTGRSWSSSWFLDLAWHSPNHSGYLKSEPMDGKPLSLPLWNSCFEINKWKRCKLAELDLAMLSPVAQGCEKNKGSTVLPEVWLMENIWMKMAKTRKNENFLGREKTQPAANCELPPCHLKVEAKHCMPQHLQF